MESAGLLNLTRKSCEHLKRWHVVILVAVLLLGLHLGKQYTVRSFKFTNELFIDLSSVLLPPPYNSHWNTNHRICKRERERWMCMFFNSSLFLWMRCLQNGVDPCLVEKREREKWNGWRETFGIIPTVCMQLYWYLIEYLSFNGHEKSVVL